VGPDLRPCLDFRAGASDSGHARAMLHARANDANDEKAESREPCLDFRAGASASSGHAGVMLHARANDEKVISRNPCLD
jgi:hypothetical protein